MLFWRICSNAEISFELFFFIEDRKQSPIYTTAGDPFVTSCSFKCAAKIEGREL